MAAIPKQVKPPDDWGGQHIVSESEDDDLRVLSPGCSKTQGTANSFRQEFLLKRNRFDVLTDHHSPNVDDMIPGTDQDMLDALNENQDDEWQTQASVKKKKRKSLFGSPQFLDYRDNNCSDNHVGSSNDQSYHHNKRVMTTRTQAQYDGSLDTIDASSKSHFYNNGSINPSPEWLVNQQWKKSKETMNSSTRPIQQKETHRPNTETVIIVEPISSGDSHDGNDNVIPSFFPMISN